MAKPNAQDIEASKEIAANLEQAQKSLGLDDRDLEAAKAIADQCFHKTGIDCIKQVKKTVGVTRKKAASIVLLSFVIEALALSASLKSIED